MTTIILPKNKRDNKITVHKGKVESEGGITEKYLNFAINMHLLDVNSKSSWNLSDKDNHKMSSINKISLFLIGLVVLILALRFIGVI